MKLSAKENNAFFALKRLLNLRNISVTTTTLKNKLVIEPTFPSPVSLSNVLKDFNMFSVVALIKPDLLTRTPTPAIAYFENGMGYVTIDKIENNQVTWCHNEMGIFKESIAEFTQKWQGVILVGKSNKLMKLGEENFEANLRLENITKFRMQFIYASLAFILGYFILKNVNTVANAQIGYFYRISFIKIIGLILSMILIRFSINPDKSIVDSSDMLSKLKNTFINSLNLESRKILDWLTWSEIGLIYFLLGLSSLFLLDVSNTLVFLKWLNFITIPYTLWAIYFQIAVIKKWCLICLGAMVLLWIEFYFLINIPLFFKENTSFSISLILTIFLLLTVNWVFIKKHLINSIVNEDFYTLLQKTKFSVEYVRSTFKNNQSLIPFFAEMQIILVGNSDAEQTVLAVLNPNSILCAIKFNELVSLVTSNTKINCKIILVPDSSNDLLGTKIIRNIFNVPEDQRLLTLSNWFKQLHFAKNDFSNDSEESNKSSFNINENMNWAILTRIPLTTPTIFFDNSILPSIYSIKDISKLLHILNSKS
jgi:hypothetical protein